MNNIKLRIFIFAIIFPLHSCKNHENDTCKWNSASTLYSDVLYHGKDTSYIHFLILEGFPVHCVDSIDISQIVESYIDTVSNSNEKRNLEYIQVYNSSEDFDISKMGQSWDKINKAFLFEVRINKKTEKIRQIKKDPWTMFN